MKLNIVVFYIIISKIAKMASTIPARLILFNFSANKIYPTNAEKTTINTFNIGYNEELSKKPVSSAFKIK